MKNLFRCLLVSICLSSCCSTAFGWGMKGHDIVAAIAANNLKPGVAKKLNRILDGHTLMYYSFYPEVRTLPIHGNVALCKYRRG